MRRSGCLIAGIVFIVLLIVGFLFPVPRPQVSLPAEAIFHLNLPLIGKFPITNTYIASWLSILALAIVFRIGTSKMALIPSKWQNVVETVVEMLINFVEGVAGKRNGRRFFPIIATIFFFVLANAWLSLLPGFNTIGFGEVEEYKTGFVGTHEGFVVKEPLLRAANTDINVPLTLALMSFIFVEYWGVSSLGILRYVGKFIRVGGLFRGIGQLFRGRVRRAFIELFQGAIDAFVGVLEALSEFIRIISFTFRLFGNMTAGEVLLLMIAFLIPWVLVDVFYSLEVILGLVQALIFSGLTLVFATVAVASHDEEHEKAEAVSTE